MSGGALSIKLRCASWQQLATIYKRDLSKGTMFLKATAPPPIGTSVRIDLTLPSSSVVVLTGVIQHHVSDPQRGSGVELKLAPIPTGSIWLIESALGADQRTPQHSPSTGVPVVLPQITSGPVASIGMGGDGEDLVAAEVELTRALIAEADSLKKLNPFLVLGVGYEANDADVRGAFGELTKRYHPDRFARYESTNLRSVAADIFILIRDAYRKLGDEASRAQQLTAIGKPRATPAPMPSPAIRGGGHRVPTAQIPVPRATPATRPVETGAIRRPEPTPPPQPVVQPRPAATDPADAAALEQLLDDGRLDEALAGYKALSKKHAQDRNLRAGIELCEGLLALNLRDRLEAAQRFETALEIDPSNERAARELADMRRQATNERKGLLSRLMGKRET